LLCNCLYGLSIGQYGDDFHNYPTWKGWWERKEVKETNERLLRYPSWKCADCDEYRFCGGGSCLQWFSFEPREILG
jgi:MoaA/NifB/PqqE/SkfB family radical SAM enzyme